MKRLLLFLSLLLSAGITSSASGREGRSPLRFGIDWGYGVDFYKYWNINYLDSEVGYRVWDQDYAFGFRPNAYATASLGVELSSRTTVSAFSGVMGLSEGRSVIPMCLQASYIPAGNAKGGLLFTAAAGIGINTDLESYYRLSTIAMIGAGWRIPLNTVWDMDVILRIRGAHDSPPIWDEDVHNYVPRSDIRKNITITTAAEFGIAISF